MEPRQIVATAEAVAEKLVQDAVGAGLSYCELLQVVDLSLRLLRSTYPGPKSETFFIGKEAEAILLGATLPENMRN